MKFCVAIVIIGYLSCILADTIKLSEEQKDKAQKYGEECIKQENITVEEATKLKNRDFTNPSDNVKCFANCFFEKAGTIKDGVVQEDVVLEKLGPLLGEDRTKIIMKECNALKGENNCDTAFKLYQCYEKFKSEVTDKVF
ncbi:general odorant-binding protein 56a-like [Teleopsis dalmanni]|uniref:general odorant-binding protein 56a-like n=1 Tax=Teleopsis dalmanni TaxID=139649 RepID=UPI0018CCE212|nr:general odorant-binding protein 56a-like [Teleopsis dalmanni]